MQIEKNVNEIWIIERLYKGNWYHYATRTNEEQAKNYIKGLNKTKGTYRIRKFIDCSQEQLKINL